MAFKTGPLPTLLVVSKEEACLKLFEEESSLSCKVLSAGKVGQAIQMLLNQKFECIVVDFDLDERGVELVIAAIRKDPLHINYESPVVIIGAKFDPDALKRIGRQVQSALVKPFEENAFLSRINDILKIAA